VAICVFCEILANKLPASVIYKDELCTVFLDIQPINPGHMLVTPNKHAAYLADLDEETAAHLFKVAQRMAAALRTSGVKCEGVNIFLADGKAAMQDVSHTHLHVFPRFEGDGFGLKFSPVYYHRPDRTYLDKVAEDLKKAL